MRYALSQKNMTALSEKTIKKFYHGNGFCIGIDDNRNDLLTAQGRAMLKKDYCLPQESEQECFARVACAYADDQAHAQRMYDAISQHFFMPATPVLCNGGTKRGLPISCFLNEPDDTMDSLVDNWAESAMLSVRGGGIGTYMGNIRSSGETLGINGASYGIMPFIKIIESLSKAMSQGTIRKGATAIYLLLAPFCFLKP